MCAKRQMIGIVSGGVTKHRFKVYVLCVLKVLIFIVQVLFYVIEGFLPYRGSLYLFESN